MKILPLHTFLYTKLQHEPCISIIGAGGKTTLLYTLGEIFSKHKRTFLTTTTHMMLPTHLRKDQILLEANIQTIINCSTSLLYYASPYNYPKVKGPSISFIKQTLTYCDYLCIEADGARHHDIKFAKEDEPVIPTFCDCVIQVIGIRALGKPIKECLHRYELAIQAFSWKEDEILDIEKIIQLIKHNFSHTSCKRKIVIINQVDTLSYEVSLKKLLYAMPYEIWCISLHHAKLYVL